MWLSSFRPDNPEKTHCRGWLNADRLASRWHVRAFGCVAHQKRWLFLNCLAPPLPEESLRSIDGISRAQRVCRFDKAEPFLGWHQTHKRCLSPNLWGHVKMADWAFRGSGWRRLKQLSSRRAAIENFGGKLGYRQFRR